MTIFVLALIFVAFLTGTLYGRFVRVGEAREKVTRKIYENRSHPNEHVKDNPNYIRGFEDGMIWVVEEMYGYPLEWKDKRGDIRGR